MYSTVISLLPRNLPVLKNICAARNLISCAALRCRSVHTSFVNNSILKVNKISIANNHDEVLQTTPHRSFSSDIPKALWNLGRLNHVAIAVPDLEKATSFYRDILGATVSAPQALPSHGVTTVFIELSNTKLELLHPLGDKSPIAKFLAKNRSGGLHHVCIEVDDITQAMASVKAAGVRCLSAKPSIGAHGKPVVFLHPQDCNGVLLELEEV